MTEFLDHLETELRAAHGRRRDRSPARRALDAAPRAALPVAVAVAVLGAGGGLAAALSGGGHDAAVPARAPARGAPMLTGTARTAPIVVLNGTSSPGLGRTVAQRLLGAGGRVLRVADAQSQRVATTYVMYAAGHRRDAAAVVALLQQSTSTAVRVLPARARTVGRPATPVPPPARTVTLDPRTGTVVATTPSRSTATAPPVAAVPTPSTPPRTATVVVPSAVATAPLPATVVAPSAVATAPLPATVVAPSAVATAPLPATRWPVSLRPLDAATHVVAGSTATVVVVVGRDAANRLGGDSVTAPARPALPATTTPVTGVPVPPATTTPVTGVPVPPATTTPVTRASRPATGRGFPAVVPAVTRNGCPDDAVALGRFGPRQAGMAAREAWQVSNPDDLPKVRSATTSATSARRAQVRHACGAAVARLTAVVQLDLVARHPSASASEVVLFVSRTRSGWRIWQRAH